MDQIGQKQKANEQNRVKPRPKDGERSGKFSSSRPVAANRRRQAAAEVPRARSNRGFPVWL